jgi:hypothetical protein
MKEEKYELSYDAVPGYKPLFFVIFAVSLIYLAVIFFNSF